MKRKTHIASVGYVIAKPLILTVFIAVAGHIQAQTTANAGAPAAPAGGTLPSGTIAGTFQDMSQAGSWSVGVPDIGTEAIFSGGHLGTTADFSANKLTLGSNTNLYGGSYQATAQTDPKTITLGSGGLTSGSTTDSRIGPNLILAVGTTHQTWTVASGRILSYQGRLTGSATITVNGPGRLWKRDNNSTFTGAWNVTNGSTLWVEHRFAIGGSTASVALSNNSTLRVASASSVFDRALSLGSGGGKLFASATGTVFSGVISGSNPLTTEQSANVAFTINSDMNNHVGSLAISRATAGSSVSFGAGTDPLVNQAKLTFKLGTTGIVDGVDTSAGSAASLIRGGTGTNGVAVNFTNSLFTINRSLAGLANGNQWRLVDVDNLDETFGDNFSVSGFTEGSPGVWTLAEGESTWTFSESTGMLSLAYTGTLPIIPITTTGTTFDMSLGSTWDGGVVPQNTLTEQYIAVFDVAKDALDVLTDYTAPDTTVFDWKGMVFDTAGVEIDPAADQNITINLGNGGISGMASRLGNTNGLTTINVGSINQTWTPHNSVGANITGSATITFGGSAAMWLRGNNNGFSGKWLIPNGAGGELRTTDNNSIGGAAAALDMGTGTTLRFTGVAATQSHVAAVTLTGTSGTFRTAAALTTTLNGSVTGGTTPAPATLTLQPDSGAASAINFHGPLANHVGAIVVNKTNPGGFTLTFGNEATDEFSLVIGANKIVDGVDTTTVPLISAGTGAETSSVVFNNRLTIDTSSANSTDGNSWNMIDTTNLTVSTDTEFNVDGFTPQFDGITWTRNADGKLWTLNMSTGVLSVGPGVASGFSSWITGTFANGSVPGSQQGANQDPDGDGISNLIEYAIAGLDPTVSNSSLGTLTGKSISFDKRQPLASDISYFIETSTDLGINDPWTNAAAVNTGTSISHTLPAGPARNFMRLKVTQP
jgi:hypothetical protein